MALTKNAGTTSTGHNFEGDDTDVGSTADTGAVEQETKVLSANERVAAAAAKNAQAPQTQTQTSTSTAVAQAKPAGGAVTLGIAKMDPFKSLENALTVEWNTLPRITPTNGNFQNKETQKLMGDKIGLEVLSIQDHYVVSPGGDIEDEEAKPFIKYSDDGIVTREGQPIAEAIAAAKAAGYEKASLKKRMILVAAVTDGGKQPEMSGELVQMDMAPNTVKNFNQFRFSNAYQIGKGLRQAEGSNTLIAEAVVKSEGKKTWTEATFRAAN